MEVTAYIKLYFSSTPFNITLLLKAEVCLVFIFLAFSLDGKNPFCQ